MNLAHTSPATTSLSLTHDIDNIAGVAQRWHNDNHPDAWSMCLEQPCRDIQEFYVSDYDAVRSWHDRAHADSWSSCMEQPCHAVKKLHHGEFALNVGPQT